MKIQFEVLPPDMPNYVRFKNEPVLKQQGFRVAEGFDIKNFSEEEAKEFANFMYDTFMKHWKDRRDQASGSPNTQAARSMALIAEHEEYLRRTNPNL